MLRDGRGLEGTGLQIVQAMQSTAFGTELMSIGEYVDWVLGNLERFEGLVRAALDPGTPSGHRR